MKKKLPVLEQITLGKLVHGGQCLAEAPDGRKIFVWGGLPNEVVDVQLTKKKNSYLEGVVTHVAHKSLDRIEPKEPAIYLSSSPWQHMTYAVENSAKQSILEETFAREGVAVSTWQPFFADSQEYGYRNKIELGFWGDDTGLHYASYVRGSHRKQIITSHALAKEPINEMLEPFLKSLRTFVQMNAMKAGDLKTVVFRCSMQGEVVAALFIKKDIPADNFILPDGLKGLVICYSNPKSPASVSTKVLYTHGDITITDSILGNYIKYDVFSFFQVHIPVFEQVLRRINTLTSDTPKVDMYAGVGTIGISLSHTDTLVDIDAENIRMAILNSKGTKVKSVHAASEQALEYIDDTHVLIVDPPRAGLHPAVTARILEVLPPQIVYLSCNPSTQARDIKLLESKYAIAHAEGFNFFPRTPHIESLILLEKL